jgi:hypothetical protein
MTVARADRAGGWWATWWPFWLAWPVTGLLYLLVLWASSGSPWTWIPVWALLPYGAVAAVLREDASTPILVAVGAQLPLYALVAQVGARLRHLRAAVTVLAALHIAATILGRLATTNVVCGRPRDRRRVTVESCR